MKIYQKRESKYGNGETTMHYMGTGLKLKYQCDLMFLIDINIHLDVNTYVYKQTQNGKEEPSQAQKLEHNIN